MAHPSERREHAVGDEALRGGEQRGAGDERDEGSANVRARSVRASDVRASGVRACRQQRAS